MVSQRLWNPGLVVSTTAGGILRAAIAVCALLFAAFPAFAQTATTYSNSTDSAVDAISDTATPCSNPFKRTFTVGTSYTVSDVDVGVLMAHTYRGDLVMSLVSPLGTRVQLTNGQGGAAANFNAKFDDEAGSGIAAYTANSTATASTVVPLYGGNYIPSAALSAFDGENSAGIWTLEICDTFAIDSGTFFQADLTLSSVPTTYADLSLSKSVSSSSPATGATISYTLTVTNAAGSPNTATGVVVRDLLASGVTFVSASGTGTYNSTTGNWAVGTLAPGQSASLTITVIVTAGAGTTVINNAEVTASSVADVDSTPNNGSTTEDDDASSSFTATSTRSAGIPPTLSCPAGSALFDWDSQTWAAGSTSNSYTVSGIGSVAFGITNPGIFVNDASLGGQSPTRQAVITGGLAGGQNSLAELVDLPNQSSTVNTTITLGATVPGAQFKIFDVDYGAGQFADKVTVTGYLGATAVSPVLTNGVANYVLGTSAYGDGTSSDPQANGNVTVTFGAPIDRIVIAYGNHSLAPTNPGLQAIAIHDITLCKPQAVLSVTKISSVISDPVNGTSFPKALPGAVMEYCILISNAGPATATSLSATDTLPANFTYATGTMLSGTSCASAATVEDDNNLGTDESDPYGAAITGSTITASAASLTASSAFALKFRGTVN